jgi:hypothetical protein
LRYAGPICFLIGPKCFSNGKSFVELLDYQGIGLNYPFGGNDGPSRRFGKPKDGYDALLIEFNRELFVDSRKNQDLFVGPQMKEVIPWKILRVNICLAKAIDSTLKKVYNR